MGINKEMLRNAKRGAEERRLRDEERKNLEGAAIDREQQKVKETEAAEALRLVSLCDRHMLKEQKAIQKRNIAFLKGSEDLKRAHKLTSTASTAKNAAFYIDTRKFKVLGCAEH